MASIFQDAVTQALATQPWWQRRKDSITAVAGLVLQVGNLLLANAGQHPLAHVAVAVVIGAAQILVHAGTRGAITPSMAARLEQAGMLAHMERPSVSGVLARDYEGKHRAQHE